VPLLVPARLRSGRTAALRGRAGVLPLICVLAAALPLILGLNPFTAGLGAIIGIWIIFADGYTVIYGLAGQFSVGHAALWGAGAYATAILTTRLGWAFWPTVPVAIAIGCCLGVLIAAPSWRLRGDYIALVTLAAGVIAQQLMLNWDQVTGGAAGIANIPLVTIGSHVLSDNDYYALLLGLALLCTAFTSHLKRSPLGLAWQAIREDELAAQASGMRTYRLKVLAFVVGGGIAGLSGSLFAVFNGFISSVSFGIDQSVLVILMVLIGGPGRVWSTAIVAAVLTALTAELTQLSAVSVGVTGALMLAAILLRNGAGSAVVYRILEYRLAARPAVWIRARGPGALTSTGPRGSSAPVPRAPEVREPEVREPEVREPEVREPEVREP
jgi:branched-chain amino acid transport system permease protein